MLGPAVRARRPNSYVKPRLAGARRVGNARAWIIPCLLFILTAGLHALLVRHMWAPIVHGDEYAYLYSAHYLALGGPLPHTVGYPGTGINPGYSLLFVPLWWVTKDAYTVYRGALVINTLLAGAMVVLLYTLAGRLAPRLSTGARIVVTAVVAAYPSFLLFSNLIVSENLLIPGFLVVCLVAMRAFSTRRPVMWAALGAVGGLLYVVHPRAVAVVIALVLVASWVLWPWRANWQPMAAFGVSLAVSLAGSQALVDYVSRGTTTNPGLFHLSRAGDYPLIFYGMAGRLLYLLIGTAGLFALGIWAVARRAGPVLRRGDAGPDVSTAVFMVIALLGMWLLGSLVLAEGVRIDYFIHGRYDEAVLAPILLLGALLATELRTPTLIRPLVRVSIAASFAIVVCALIVGVARRGETHATLVRIETFAIDSLFRVTHLSLNVAVLAMAGIFATLVSFLAWRRGFLIGAVVVVALFIPSAVTARAYLVSGSAGRASDRVVPDTLMKLHQTLGLDGTCVAYDLATDSPFFFYNDRLFDPSDSYSPFDSRRDQRPCSDVVVSGRRDLEGIYPGAKLVALEHNGEQALWVLPGTLQDRLVKQGWTVPNASSPSSPAQHR